MTEQNEERKQPKREQKDKEKPQIYSVKKGLTGWNFSRREFLTAAAATAAAATGAAMAATGGSDEATSEAAKVVGDSIPLVVTMPAMMGMQPGEPFTQVWQFTNNSDSTWCRGAKLHLVDGDQMQAPASVPVPDIAPGGTVTVKVEMVAPAEPGTYRGKWRLEVAGNADPVASGPLVFQNGCLAESLHPCENNMDRTWEVTNPDTDAQHTRVHFSQVAFGSSSDYIILKDKEGQEHQRITDNHPSGLWSNPVPGRVVQVQLVTGSEGTAYGFRLDQLQTDYFVYAPLVFKQPTLTPTPTPRPTATPCPCDTVYCTCDYVHYWYPC